LQPPTVLHPLPANVSFPWSSLLISLCTTVHDRHANHRMKTNPCCRRMVECSVEGGRIVSVACKIDQHHSSHWHAAGAAHTPFGAPTLLCHYPLWNRFVHLSNQSWCRSFPDRNCHALWRHEVSVVPIRACRWQISFLVEGMACRHSPAISSLHLLPASSPILLSNRRCVFGRSHDSQLSQSPGACSTASTHRASTWASGNPSKDARRSSGSMYRTKMDHNKASRGSTDPRW
jgi:hypothetical protein